MRPITWILPLAISLAGGAKPQQPMAMANKGSSACPAGAEAVPPSLAGWTRRKPLTASPDSKGTDRATLVPGVAVDLALSPAPRVIYAHPPERPVSPSTYGGLLAFTVDRAGIIRIAIGSSAWIDLLDPTGHVVHSIAHARGPSCSGIHKMVDFTVGPGLYTLQIVGSDQAVVAALVAPLKK